jgi:chromosome partitioning protein
VSAPIIAFGNQRLGTGTTSLVYHLAWMFADLNLPVLAVDLDPQSDLTRALVDVSVMPVEWQRQTSFVQDLKHCILDGGTGKEQTHPFRVTQNLSLLAGDLSLGRLEDSLEWTKIRLAIRNVITGAAAYGGASIVLADLGATLGAVNRAALLAADNLVVPVAQDPLSTAGMANVVDVLREWRTQPGRPAPLGYVIRENPMRLSPQDWKFQIPRIFQKLTSESQQGPPISVSDDPRCLAILKHYHSLMPMAQDARKPMFHLRVADGATGAHLQAALEAGRQFEQLARRIAEGAGVKIPQFSRSTA